MAASWGHRGESLSGRAHMGEWITESVTVFHGRRLPEPARPTGYSALWHRYELAVPLPTRLAAIAQRHRQSATAEWLILTPRHAPEESLAGHLEFALKWEGVNLGVLKRLFGRVPAEEIVAIVRAKPTGVYARRLWFLYEWLRGGVWAVRVPGKVRSIPAGDPKHPSVPAEGQL